MRHAALDRRHGGEVAALGPQARELSEAWEGFRARVASEGNGVALDDGFGETLRQHRGFLKAAKPFRDPRFSTLLKRRAGIDLDAINASERAYRRAGRFRRSVLATEARKTDDERRSARIGAAANSETATPTESSRAAQESEAMARTPTMREQLPHPRELAAGLAQRAEEVCRRYLPNGVRSGGYLARRLDRRREGPVALRAPDRPARRPVAGPGDRARIRSRWRRSPPDSRGCRRRKPRMKCGSGRRTIFEGCTGTPIPAGTFGSASPGSRNQPAGGRPDTTRWRFWLRFPISFRAWFDTRASPTRKKRRGVRAFHHFAGAVKLDGELMRVRLTVKEGRRRSAFL